MAQAKKKAKLLAVEVSLIYANNSRLGVGETPNKLRGQPDTSQQIQAGNTQYSKQLTNKGVRETYKGRKKMMAVLQNKTGNTV